MLEISTWVGTKMTASWRTPIEAEVGEGHVLLSHLKDATDVRVVYIPPPHVYILGNDKAGYRKSDDIHELFEFLDTNTIYTWQDACKYVRETNGTEFKSLWLLHIDNTNDSVEMCQ